MQNSTDHLAHVIIKNRREAIERQLEQLGAQLAVSEALAAVYRRDASQGTPAWDVLQHELSAVKSATDRLERLRLEYRAALIVEGRFAGAVRPGGGELAAIVEAPPGGPVTPAGEASAGDGEPPPAPPPEGDGESRTVNVTLGG